MNAWSNVPSAFCISSWPTALWGWSIANLLFSTFSGGAGAIFRSANAVLMAARSSGVGAYGGGDVGLTFFFAMSAGLPWPVSVSMI